MSELLIDLGQWFRGYQYQTSMAIVATLLVIFGGDINQMVKKSVAKYHFIIRSLVFIVLCTFGYGLLTVYLTKLLSQQLSQIPNLYIIPSIGFVFVLLGIYAQNKRYI